MSTSLSYRDAGVDIDAGDQLVENIKPFAKRTMRPEVLGDLGGFGALVEISKKYTDGVIIWSDKRDENNQIVRWNDPRIQATMKATQAFINANAKEIKVEGLQKY